MKMIPSPAAGFWWKLIVCRFKRLVRGYGTDNFVKRFLRKSIQIIYATKSGKVERGRGNQEQGQSGNPHKNPKWKTRRPKQGKIGSQMATFLFKILVTKIKEKHFRL